MKKNYGFVINRKMTDYEVSQCFTSLSVTFTGLNELTYLPTKYQTRLERIAREKRSSFLQKFVNYGQKKFYNLGPLVLYYKELRICKEQKNDRLCSKLVFYIMGSHFHRLERTSLLTRKTLDQAGKACQGQTLQPITEIC